MSNRKAMIINLIARFIKKTWCDSIDCSFILKK